MLKEVEVTPMATKSNSANIELLMHDIEELKDIVKEYRVYLTGKDGAPGLIGNFSTMCAKMASMELLFQKDMANMQSKIDLMFANMNKTNEERQDNNVKYSDVLKEWLKPVITAIITGILTYFIITSGIAK